PATRKRAVECLWPVALAVVAAAVFVSLSRGTAANSTAADAFRALTSMQNVPRNLVAFLCFQALAGPILVYALLSRGWQFVATVSAVVALGIALSWITASAALVLYAV